LLMSYNFDQTWILEKILDVYRTIRKKSY
jgi:hypothetical protein